MDIKIVINLLIGLSFVASHFSVAAKEWLLNDGTVIYDAKIISPHEAPSETLKSVIIDNGEIIYIGSELPDISGRFARLDARGSYLIPGLIDSHVHVSSTHGLSAEDSKNNPDIVLQLSAQLPKSYLYFGFTTLVDLGAYAQAPLDMFQKQPLKPDLYYVGNGVVIGDGYGAVRKDGEPSSFVAIDNHQHNPAKAFNASEQTASAVVKRIAASGAIAIKTYYEPGWWPGANLPVPSQTMLKDILYAAHENELPLVVHGNSLEAHNILSDIKADILAHGVWRGYQFTPENELPSEVKRVLSRHIANHTAYTPTLRVIDGLAAMADDSFLNDPHLQFVLPQNILDFYAANRKELYQRQFSDVPKLNTLKNFEKISLGGSAALKYMAENGGNIIFGSDTPSSPTYGNPPGYNGFLELQAMANAGMFLKDIFNAVTINAAEAYFLDDFYGSVEPGKKANLLLLAESPLESVAAYNKITHVIIQGRIIERSSLKAN